LFWTPQSTSKNRRTVIEQTVYNPQKGSLETIDIKFTDKNTTWFDEPKKNDGVYMMPDLEGCLVIADCDYSYPILLYDISRSDINYDKQKAWELRT
jgi:hypothetical protein